MFPGGTWAFLTSSSPSPSSPSADSSPLSDGSSSLSDGLLSEPSASADAVAFSSSSSSSSSLLESMTMALDLLPVFLGLDGLGLFFFLVLVVESSPDRFFFDFLFFLTGRRCGGTNVRVSVAPQKLAMLSWQQLLSLSMMSQFVIISTQISNQ